MIDRLKKVTPKTYKLIVDVPVGKELLGRVVDGLGAPIDGKGNLSPKASRKSWSKSTRNYSSSISKWTDVICPKAIDSLIPIGRGQRELIIGDRQTGKTAVAVDTIINQKAINEPNDEKKNFIVFT